MPPKPKSEDRFCKFLKEGLKVVEDLNKAGNNVNLQVEYNGTGGNFLYVTEVDHDKVTGKLNDIDPEITLSCK